MIYGHRNDPEGFHRCLQEIDARHPRPARALGPDDLLVLTSDHGCDPTTPSTDHSREHALLVAHVPASPRPARGTTAGSPTSGRQSAAGSARDGTDGLPGAPIALCLTLRAVDLIERKRDGAEHRPGDPLADRGCVAGRGRRPSRLAPGAMAVVLRGLSDAETTS